MEIAYARSIYASKCGMNVIRKDKDAKVKMSECKG